METETETEAERGAGRSRPGIGAATAAALVALAVVLWGTYERGWTWTGFSGNDTLWDWLQLLLLPLAVAAVPVYLRRRRRLPDGVRRAHHTALAAFVVLVVAGYAVPWRWTGFTGNTLWDWLGLVALPVAVVIVPLWLERGAPLPAAHRTALTTGAVAFVVLVVAGYAVPWRWTGFTGNTLWDWLRLAIVPLLLPLVLEPAVAEWAGARGAEAGGDRRARRFALVPVAIGVLGVLGVAGSQALTHHATDRAAPATGCGGPGGTTLAADPSLALRSVDGRVWACAGPAPPVALGRGVDAGLAKVAADRGVVVRRPCARGGCPALLEQVRAGGRRPVVRRLAPGGRVTGLGLVAGGRVAVALREGTGGRLDLVGPEGTRTLSSGPSFDPESLATHRATVYWRFGGQPSSIDVTAP